MRSLILVPLAGLMSFTLAAVIPQSVDTSSRGMVYGHFDTPASLERVELARAHSVRRPTARVLSNGDFYFADIEPGEYVVLRYESNGAWHDVAVGKLTKDFTVFVEPGGIHYVGAWRDTGAPREGMKPSDPVLERIIDPAPDQLLRRLRPSLRGTGWEKLIKR